MVDIDKTGQAESIDRRRLLSVIGGGAATALLGTGVGAAKPDHANGNGNGGKNGNNGVGPCTCDGCPDGTFCGKIEGAPEDGETYTFESDGDSFSVTVESVTEKDDGEVTCFEFSSDDVVKQVCVKGGPDTATYDDDPEGKQLCAPENPGGQQSEISNVSFCGARLECYQIDLVEGKVIEDFGDEGAYGDRKFEDFSVCEDGSNEYGLEEQNDGYEAAGCTLSWDGLGFDASDNTAQVDVTLKSAESEPCTVTLAGYLLPEGETKFNPETLEEQELRGYETEELTVDESATLKIDLDGGD
ncbi:hypothetical protein Har1130_12805 [Haloarcula sp. CBA1130]|uniref:hypothetical protein n=1 Tax=unclassified Haloarcula TaxID=2624677 RepID=UPI001244662B|nr:MULTISPECIES: hypothetical protein [unclassified Haloarcula]KAA9399080.1 hypothetical protein Har1129_12905 [Haloarcula sp. CBA1129]KAA9403594.1 hypothetical protein Har1130_12805 [Haloarcula sp. CBA1130]